MGQAYLRTIYGLWQEPAQRLGAKDRHSLLAVGKAQSRMKMLTKLQEEAVAVGWVDLFKYLAPLLCTGVYAVIKARNHRI